MKNSQGHLVPVDAVKEIDKARDALVREIVAKAASLSELLARFKAASMADIEAFVELSAEKYGAKKLGGRKGNVLLTSYDGEWRVLRAMADNLIFDERLQIAKQLIDECIQEWAAGSRAEIMALVNDAFYQEKAGKINTARILGLRRLDIKDEKWLQAMNAIGDSLQVAGSRAYLRIYRRTKGDQYEQVNLDLAAL
jgi:hypothetical protein